MIIRIINKLKNMMIGNAVNSRTIVHEFKLPAGGLLLTSEFQALPAIASGSLRIIKRTLELEFGGDLFSPGDFYRLSGLFNSGVRNASKEERDYSRVSFAAIRTPYITSENENLEVGIKAVNGTMRVVACKLTLIVLN